MLTALGRGIFFLLHLGFIPRAILQPFIEQRRARAGSPINT